MKQGPIPVSLPCVYCGYNVRIRKNVTDSCPFLQTPNPFRICGDFVFELVKSFLKKQIPDTLSCQLTHFSNIAHIIPSFIYRGFTNQREG